MEFNYKELGFKSGLEIHQQLDSHKLFCNCPSVLRQDKPDFEIRRKLHLVAGESGKVDAAAEYQASLGKEFIYQAYDTTCLVELDEEPPHEINKEALKFALQIAIFLHANILPITQVMRKTVIDGSNTSGFQRTVMIARDGFVETQYGRVGIAGIFLEEDAARLISKDEKSVTYRLDRLGIPMIEIATAPDIKSPEQAKEVTLFIGDVLRSCKVKRGIGTIRQDVNMSIKSGARTELKGVQDPDVIVNALNKEIERQLALITEKKKVDSSVRNVFPDGSSEFLRPMPGSDRMYPETDLPILKISHDFINETKRDLPRLRKDIEKDLLREGLSEEYIRILFKENKIEEYKEHLMIIHNPKLVAKTLLIFPKEIATRKNLNLEKVNEILEDDFSSVLSLVKKKEIPEEHIKDVLEALVDGKSLEEAVKFEKTESSELEEIVMNIIKAKPGLSENAYMGLVMKELHGKITGGEAMEIIRKLMK
jgi:Glu-tRNA(Gln) amidotransferase subunit E-like FAD-binding protein